MAGGWGIKLLLANIFVVPAGGGANVHRSKSKVFPPFWDWSFTPVPLGFAAAAALAFVVVMDGFELNSPLATLAAGTILVGVSDFFLRDFDSVFSVAVVGGAAARSGEGEIILGCCRFFTIVIASLRSGCERSFVLRLSQ